jgi:hypothetical protein
MARGRHLRRAGGCPSPRMLEEEKGHWPTREAEPSSTRSSSSAWMMNILEAEGGAEAAAQLASPHHKAGDHAYG